MCEAKCWPRGKRLSVEVAVVVVVEDILFWELSLSWKSSCEVRWDEMIGN
jgi:hypothetical protein